MPVTYYKIAALVGFAVMAGLVILRLSRRYRPAEHMSHEWLAEQEQRDIANSAWQEGIAIRWPMNKIVNEAGQFNARRLRRSA